MPKLLEPGKRYAVGLESDKDTTPRPKFWAGALSRRGVQDLEEQLDEAAKGAESSVELHDKTATILFGQLKGWEGMILEGNELEFTSENVSEYLTYPEMRELLNKIMWNQHLSAEEKKS